MKKRQLKNLQLNKKLISNLEIFVAKGGSGRVCNAESRIICDEADTFNTICSELSRQGSNCEC